MEGLMNTLWFILILIILLTANYFLNNDTKKSAERNFNIGTILAVIALVLIIVS